MRASTSGGSEKKEKRNREKTWSWTVPGRVPRWGCLMGVRPREGRLGDDPPPAPWCRGVARAREDTGLARGTED